VKISNFKRFDNIRTRQKTNQLSDFKTKEKLLENIDLQTNKLKYYSLICDGFVLTETKKKYKKLDSFCAFRLESVVYQATEM